MARIRGPEDLNRKPRAMSESARLPAWTETYPRRNRQTAPQVQQSDLTLDEIARGAAELLMSLSPAYDVVDAQRNYEDAAVAAREGRYLEAVESAGWGALSNLGLSEVSAPLSAIFAGVGAKTADMAKLRRAEEMESAGADVEEVWRETGWHRGVDGEWRFEIPDAGARLREAAEKALDEKGYVSGTLDEVFDHPGLREAYPDFSDEIAKVEIELVPDNIRREYRGARNTNDGTIKIQASSKHDAKLTALHEIQHHIQNKEGFATGGSPAAMREAYRTLDREVVADLIGPRFSHVDYETTPLQALGQVSDETMEKVAKRYKFRSKEGVYQFAREALEGDASNKRYQRLAGEVEARNVERRARNTGSENAERSPLATEMFDTLRSGQLVRRKYELD